VLVPYRVATFPIFLATRGIKEGLEFADEHRILPHIGPEFPIRIGPIAAAPVAAIGGLPGLGGGATIVALRGPDQVDWIRLRYVTTVNGTHRGSAGLRVPWRHGTLEAGGGYRLQRNARYFGIGPASREADLSYFTQEQNWAGASYSRGIAGRLSSEWIALYSSIATRGPRSEDGPDVAERFSAAPPAGYDERSQGVYYGTLLRLDTTKETGRPESGVVAVGRVGYFDPTDGRFTPFWAYSGELGSFLPLWYSDRALAVRGLVAWLDPQEGGAVSFTRLPTNHSGEVLRGYRDYRWRDRGLLDLSAEYRWPVWALERAHAVGVDAYLFLNSGQVFGRWHAIATDIWKTSWGGGFRLIGKRGFAGRIEIARSPEATIIRLRADQILEFSRRGLYAGQIPVSAPN